MWREIHVLVSKKGAFSFIQVRQRAHDARHYNADVPRRRSARLAAGALKRNCVLRGDIRRLARPLRPVPSPCLVWKHKLSLCASYSWWCKGAHTHLTHLHLVPLSSSDGWEDRWVQSKAKEGLGEFVAADGEHCPSSRRVVCAQCSCALDALTSDSQCHVVLMLIPPHTHQHKLPSCSTRAMQHTP